MMNQSKSVTEPSLLGDVFGDATAPVAYTTAGSTDLRFPLGEVIPIGYMGTGCYGAQKKRSNTRKERCSWPSQGCTYAIQRNKEWQRLTGYYSTITRHDTCAIKGKRWNPQIALCLLLI